MLRDASLRTLRDKIETLAVLFEVSVLVGVLYFAYLAPAKVARGKASGMKEYIAAIPGIVFWSLAMYSLAVGL